MVLGVCKRAGRASRVGIGLSIFWRRPLPYTLSLGNFRAVVHDALRPFTLKYREFPADWFCRSLVARFGPVNRSIPSSFVGAYWFVRKELGIKVEGCIRSFTDR